MKIEICVTLVAAAIAATTPLWRPALAEEATQTAVAEPEPAEAELAAKGKALYAHHCSHCHGFNMVSAGNVTYDLRTFPHDQQERFFESVTNGRTTACRPGAMS